MVVKIHFKRRLFGRECCVERVANIFSLSPIPAELEQWSMWSISFGQFGPSQDSNRYARVDHASLSTSYLFLATFCYFGLSGTSVNLAKPHGLIRSMLIADR